MQDTTIGEQSDADSSGSCSYSSGGHGGAQRSPGFNAAREETVRLLAGLVRIDTSNPPGNETPAAEYIKQVLDREGIASEIIESAPGRGNIVARLKGNGKKKPLLLMAHLDVVGVTLPVMQTGATDSAQLRARGVQAYDLSIPHSEEDLQRIHGNDERVSVEALGQFVQYVYAAVTDVAEAK